MGSLIGWLSGLRVRLALLVVVVGLPVLGLVVQGGLEQRRRAAEAVERHALTLAQVAAQLQRHAIKHSRDVLRLLAAQPAIGVESPGACERYLDRFHDENPSFANFGVIDTDGGLVCSALAFEPPLDLTDRDYFQRALRHQGFAAGSYQVGRVTHVPSINFGYPVTRGDGVVGVVFAAVPLTWLTQLAQEARLPAGTSARLVDAAGDLLVAHPRRRDGAGWEGSELQTTLLARVGAPGAGDGTFQAVGPDGTRSLYAVTTLQPAPHADQMLYLLVGLPRTQAFAEVDRITVTNIAYITLVLLLATGLALWASGGLIVDPVRRLVEVTQRLAGGDLGARAT
ncbi:MAG: hypothetical protein GWO02_20555, partial [Gammaproteobacteria bacterium]|nr:hypothetical protein [Gammaproteobacteria bacterium]